MLEWLAITTRAGAHPVGVRSPCHSRRPTNRRGRARTDELIHDVLDPPAGRPPRRSPFAGALQFEEYNLPTRVLMRLVAASSTDPKAEVRKDTDYTDWAAVRSLRAKPSRPPSNLRGGVMKAAVVHRFDGPLSIDDVPVPEPGAEQVLVRIEAAGLCHTDIHAARGEWPVEAVAAVHPRATRASASSTGSAPATAMASRSATASRIPWLGYACGDYRYCDSGRETLCHEPARTRDIRSTAASPSTRSATRATSSRCPTASTRSTPRH